MDPRFYAEGPEPPTGQLSVPVEFLNAAYSAIKAAGLATSYLLVGDVMLQGDSCNLSFEASGTNFEQVRFAHKSVSRAIHRYSDLDVALAKEMVDAVLVMLQPCDGDVLVTAKLPAALQYDTFFGMAYDVNFRLVVVPDLLAGHWLVDFSMLAAWGRSVAWSGGVGEVGAAARYC